MALDAEIGRRLLRKRCRCSLDDGCILAIGGRARRWQRHAHGCLEWNADILADADEGRDIEFPLAGGIDIEREADGRIVADLVDIPERDELWHRIADSVDCRLAPRGQRELRRDAAFTWLAPVGDPAGTRLDLQYSLYVAADVGGRCHHPHPAAIAGCPVACRRMGSGREHQGDGKNTCRRHRDPEKSGIANHGNSVRRRRPHAHHAIFSNRSFSVD